MRRSLRVAVNALRWGLARFASFWLLFSLWSVRQFRVKDLTIACIPRAF
ncbi:MAG: hypothetical protein ACYYK0_06930 [Candidatus Eutrophobiaceae bacterium]